MLLLTHFPLTISQVLLYTLEKMKSSFIYYLIFYLCVYIFLVEGFGGLSRAGSLTGTKASRITQKKSGNLLADSNSSNSGEPKASKSPTSFLSAWGIISLIMFIVVGLVIIYYVSIFYPLICAKRGKYDVMEMTAL